MRDLLSVWPQNFINVHCFVAIGMDITAPFLEDMGVYMTGIGDLRHLARSRLEEAPGLLARTGNRKEWVTSFEEIAQKRLSERTLEEFVRWIDETLTSAPADRPSWEAYEDYLFEWQINMRDGKDTARCFDDPTCVYDAYRAFVLERRLDARIRESRRRHISEWDHRVLAWGRYSLSEQDVEIDEISDPFSVVSASANRNHFQQLWEYVSAQLTSSEKHRLLDALKLYYREYPWRTPHLVHPDLLNRRLK